MPAVCASTLFYSSLDFFLATRVLQCVLQSALQAGASFPFGRLFIRSPRRCSLYRLQTSAKRCSTRSRRKVLYVLSIYIPDFSWNWTRVGRHAAARLHATCAHHEWRKHHLPLPRLLSHFFFLLFVFSTHRFVSFAGDSRALLFPFLEPDDCAGTRSDLDFFSIHYVAAS